MNTLQPLKVNTLVGEHLINVNTISKFVIHFNTLTCILNSIM